MLRYIRHYVGSSAISEELTQDLFLTIWMARERIDPKKSLKSYLYTSARNKALDYLKRVQIERDYLKYLRIENSERWKDEANEAAGFAGDGVRNHQLMLAINDAINQLPEKRRAIFLMSREEGLIYREIAEALDISVKTVETQMCRSLAKLRKLLAEYEQ